MPPSTAPRRIAAALMLTLLALPAEATTDARIAADSAEAISAAVRAADRAVAAAEATAEAANRAAADANRAAADAYRAAVASARAAAASLRRTAANAHADGVTDPDVDRLVAAAHEEADETDRLAAVLEDHAADLEAAALSFERCVAPSQ